MSLTFNIINICNIDSDHAAFHIHHDDLRFPFFHPADGAVKYFGGSAPWVHTIFVSAPNPFGLAADLY